MHFAGGRDVSHHSGARLQAMALAVNRAASNPGQHELRVLGITEIEIDFDAAERSATSSTMRGTSSSMSSVEVMRCANFCRRTNSASFGRWGFRERRTGESEIRERTGSHDKSSCLRDYDLFYKIAESGFRFSFCSAFGVRKPLGGLSAFARAVLSRLISSIRSRIRFSMPSFVG
jgi:hypothetical protein